MTDPTQRFSGKIKNYLTYRPGYPTELVHFLEDELDLNKNWCLADIGSGTGKLTELFLLEGYRVEAIEPNDEMRHAAEVLLGAYPGFSSIKGTAESTGVQNNRYDLILAGQAFHWFDPELSKKEFLRVLKPNGWVGLIWNERNINSPFLMDYEQFLLEYSTDYGKVVHRNIDDRMLGGFFDPKTYSLKIFDNYQLLDLEGTKGRYLSCSYALPEEHPLFAEGMKALTRLFQQHVDHSHVKMAYKTKVYYGKPAL